MKRVQLALNVSDLDASIDFYSKFFHAEPAKVRPGYANFALDEPPLKLVLIEGGGQPGTINHFGVEVSSTEDVNAAAANLSSIGLPIDVEQGTTCCYAIQDKVWVGGPDGSRWEVYTVLANAESEAGLSGDDRCCSSTSSAETAAVCC